MFRSKRVAASAVSKRHLRRLVQNRICQLNPTSQTQITEICVSHSSSSSVPCKPILVDNTELLNSDNREYQIPNQMLSDLAHVTDSDLTSTVPTLLDLNSINHQDINCTVSLSEESGKCGDQNIRSELVEWAISGNVSHTNINRLLKILQKHDCFSNLPVDSRTLLQTMRECPIKTVGSGEYCHFGLKKNLEEFLIANLDYNLESINLMLNIDGLPISRSSTNCFWPILGNIFGFSNVFIIGVYFGAEKPTDSTIFLADLVDECKDLVTNGLSVNDKYVSFSVKGIICDTPAKSFVLGVKSHSGYSSCTKCCIEGDYENKRVCFPYNSSFTIRTDANFRANLDTDYHVHETNIKEIPNFDIIKGVPLDYMHLVCLGITKKLIGLWIGGDLMFRLKSHDVKAISQKIVNIKHYIPCEFVRKPRSLEFMKLFKATEFRMLLLYVGPVCFSGILKKKLYDNFLVLHVAIRILCSQNISTEMIEYSDKLLHVFVSRYEKIYKKYNVSHNVHNLLHLAEDVKNFGSLDVSSAFKFENFMSSIKKLIRKSERPLQQLFFRTGEIKTSRIGHTFKILPSQTSSEFSVNHTTLHSQGPLVDGCTDPQYKAVKNNLFTLKTSTKSDNCFASRNGDIIVLENIAYCNANRSIFLIGRQFTKKQNLYSNPCPSSNLDIHVVSYLSELKTWTLNSVSHKCMKLPLKNGKFAVFPILHTERSQ